MNKKLENLINRLNSIFEKRSHEFTFENFEGEKVGAIDYCSDSIPRERVELDCEQMILVLNEGKELLTKDEFYVLVTAYCNYYIEEGFDIVLKQERFGLDSFFTSFDDKDIVYCIFKGVTTQDFTWFESVYEIDSKCTVANTYLFVKGMTDLTYAIATDRHISNLMENTVWKYYEGLNDEWKKYVLQQVEDYPLMDKSPMPYICCTSHKNHMTQMVKQYLQEILEELEIDINTVDVGDLYNIISEKYGINKTIKLIMDFVKELNENYKFNIAPNQVDISERDKKRISEMQFKLSDCFGKVAKTLLEGEVNRGNTYFNTIFMYEKLGYILLESEDEQKENTKFKNLPYPNKESSPLYRYAFLHIPAVPYDSISKNYILGRYKIFVSNRELIQKNEEIENLNNEKIDMMDYYAHSWKHISYPKIVKDVAEALLGRDDDESITMASKLLRAYNSEQTLKHGIQLLQYSISSDRETIRKEFKKGFFVIDAPKEDGIVGIENILQDSLDMVVLRLMMEEIDTSRRMQKCRTKIENMDVLREEYVEKFLRSNTGNENLLEWVNKNLFNLCFTISEQWSRVRLDKESFASAQMTEILVELITNILLHGTDSAKIEFKDDFQSMSILGLNSCNDIPARQGGKGIKTLSKVIDKINFGSNIQEGIECKKENQRFSVCIRFDRKLIYKS